MKKAFEELKQLNRVRKKILQGLEAEAQNKKPQEVEADLQEKLKTTKVSAGFRDKLKALWKISMETTRPRTRLICLGALIYFINPFDLVPDLLLPFGLMDDMAVITMALKAIKDDFLEGDDGT